MVLVTIIAMTVLDKTLVVVSRIGVFLIPFIPLVISGGMFFPFITGKNFAFRIIAEVIFVAWLLLTLRQPQYRPKKSFLLWGATIFVGIVFVADIFAENPFKAFWSNFERMEGFVTLIHLLAYFLVASAVLDTEKWWHRFFATSVGVSAFLGIYGILQLAGKIVINQGGVRLDGTFGNAAYFAGYMLFHIFLTLFLIFRHRVSLTPKLLYSGTVLLQMVALYFTATRGAFIGLTMGLFLSMFLIMVFFKENRRVRIGAASCAAVLIFIFSLLFTVRNEPWVRNNPVLTRYASISVSEAGPRFMVWGMAFEGFKEKPLLGWGQEGFNYVFNKYYNPDMWAQEQWFDRTHNIFFDWLIAAGALGLLAYLSLFFFLLRYIWKEASSNTESFTIAEKSILTGLIVAYFAHNFFVFDNIGSYILFFSLLAFIHGRSGESWKRIEELPALREERDVFYIFASVILVVLISGIYFLNVRGIQSAKDLISGLRAQPGGPLQNLAFYEKTVARNTVGSQETAEQLMQAAMTVIGGQNVPEETKKQFLSSALSTMEKEIARAPNDARLHVFMGTFFNRLQRFNDSLPHLEKAHALSPSKQTISFELANAYLNLGKLDEAVALLKDAYEGAPEFSSARITYAVATIYAKQFDRAEEILAPLPEPVRVTDERIVKAYFDVRAYDKVLAIWKARALRSPNDPQVHVSLAAAELLNNNRQQAIKELEMAITLNPEFKQQGEKYINEIRAGRNP